MKNNKKGFTIVELIIVIAVIAILASVLVPTFSGIISKAQVNADTQVTRYLNQYVALDYAEKGITKHDTMFQAVQACVKNGLSPDKISGKSDLNIAWDSTTGNFVLLDVINSKVMYPTDEITNEPYEVSSLKNYFIVTEYKNYSPESVEYSVYAYGEDWPEKITICTGFDTGSVDSIKEIKYENKTDYAKDVIIRTNSFETKLIISGLSGNYGDTIKHYGYSYCVDVQSVGNCSLEEYGLVGREKSNVGHVIAKDGSEIFCLMEVGGANTIPSTIEDKAIVHDQITNINPDQAGSTKNANGVANGLINVCNAHNVSEMAKIIIDTKHAYAVCQTCGYSLKLDGTPANTTDGEVSSVQRIDITSGSDMCEHKTLFVNGSIAYNHEICCDSCNLTYLEKHIYNDNLVCSKCSCVLSTKVVHKDGTVDYGDLLSISQEEVAKEYDTIVLLQDYTRVMHDYRSVPVCGEELYFEVDNLTIDLNNKELVLQTNRPGALLKGFVITGMNVEIKNGKLTSRLMGEYEDFGEVLEIGLGLYNTSVVINNVDIIGTIFVQGYHDEGKITTTLELNNCTQKTRHNGSNEYLFDTAHEVTVTINSGTYSIDKISYFCVSGSGGGDFTARSTVVLNGGHFTGVENIFQKTDIIIKGGTFDIRPDDSLIADGYHFDETTMSVVQD